MKSIGIIKESANVLSSQNSIASPSLRSVHVKVAEEEIGLRCLQRTSKQEREDANQHVHCSDCSCHRYCARTFCSEQRGANEVKYIGYSKYTEEDETHGTALLVPSNSLEGEDGSHADSHTFTPRTRVMQLSSDVVEKCRREHHPSTSKTEYREDCLKQSQEVRNLGRTMSLNGERFCYACGKRVYAAEQLHILNRYYHRTCFRCTSCNRLLDIGRYSVHEKAPYCLPHYDWLIRTRSTTNLTLKTTNPESDDDDEQIKDLPASTLFQNAGTVLTNDHGSCNSSVQIAGWEQSVQTFESVCNKQTRCHTCGRPIQSCQGIVLPDKVFHPDCAKCFTCQIALSISSYRDFQGKLYCAPHYAQAVAEFRESRRRATSLRASNSRPVEYSLPSMQSRDSIMTVSSTQQQNRFSWERKMSHDLPNCNICNELVHPTTFMSVDGRPCHFECLQCQMCGRQLSKMDHKELDGKVYCLMDYAVINPCKSAPKIRPIEAHVVPPPSANQTSSVRITVEKTYCFACATRVYATEALHVMNRIYHKQCFKCQWCHSTLGVENYHVHNRNPYCKPHYRQLLYNKVPDPIQNKSTQALQVEQHTCRTCQEIVQPRDCIQVLQQYYHYNCFRCEHCSEILTMGKFEMANGKPYCPTDFLLLFGRQKCTPSRQSPVHMSGFVRSQSMDKKRYNATAESHRQRLNSYCHSTVAQLDQ